MPCESANYQGDNGGRKPTRREELDKVTRLLCGLCTAVEIKYGRELMTNELREWWMQHKIADERRRQEEAFVAKHCDHPSSKVRWSERNTDSMTVRVCVCVNCGTILQTAIAQLPPL